ncbi:Vacuolar protein sorting-associated protein 37B, partial [Fragariocoptes setiger]
VINEFGSSFPNRLRLLRNLKAVPDGVEAKQQDVPESLSVLLKSAWTHNQGDEIVTALVLEYMGVIVESNNTSHSKSHKNMDELLENLDQLSLDDLLELHEDSDQSDELIERIVANESKIQKLLRIHTSLTKHVHELAESNISRQAQYCNNRNMLKQMLMETVALRDDVEDNALSTVQKATMTSVDSLHAIMLVAASEAEEDSEMLAQSFLNGYTPSGIFIDEFVEKRKLAHIRRATADKLSDSYVLYRYSPDYNRKEFQIKW